MVYRIEYAEEEKVLVEYSLQYDWVSARAHAYMEQEQMYSYQYMFARLLYN